MIEKHIPELFSVFLTLWYLLGFASGILFMRGNPLHWLLTFVFILVTIRLVAIVGEE